MFGVLYIETKKNVPIAEYPSLGDPCLGIGRVSDRALKSAFFVARVNSRWSHGHCIECSHSTFSSWCLDLRLRIARLLHSLSRAQILCHLFVDRLSFSPPFILNVCGERSDQQGGKGEEALHEAGSGAILPTCISPRVNSRW